MLRTYKERKSFFVGALNVLIQDNTVADDFRLQQALPTIRFLQESGARTIIIGHIGRNPSLSLRPVFEYFKKHIKLSFIEEVIGPRALKATDNMDNGDIVMLENLRREEGECDNSPDFTKQLASLADLYVNDDFSVSHRDHASIVGLPRHLPACVGIAFQREVEGLTPALSPLSPSLCIIGGAKFETKAPLIRKFFDLYDIIFIGGALANDFFKAQGHTVGISLVSDTPPNLEGLLNHPKLRLPVDVLAGSFEKTTVKAVDAVSSEDYIFDAGPRTGEELAKLVRSSAFVLWNGPLGQYDDGFTKQTETLAKNIIDSDAKVILGGGDTVAAVAKFHPEKSVSFVSTAGGAMLEFLLNGTLVGIEAIRNKKQ